MADNRASKGHSYRTARSVSSKLLLLYSALFHQNGSTNENEYLFHHAVRVPTALYQPQRGRIDADSFVCLFDV